MKTIYFITGNEGKVVEAAAKLRPLGYKVIQKDLGYPELQAESLDEVVQAGIEHVRLRFHKAFILEDAGLFIDALHGFPGVYSKYVFFTIGLTGVLKLLHTVHQRNAVFQSSYAYHEPGRKPIIINGECKGVITTKPRGTNGFGYDPIFLARGAKKTFGEMTVEEKNRYSHRADALNKLAAALKEL